MIMASSNSRRKQHPKVGPAPEQLIRLEGSTGKQTREAPSSSMLSKESNKRIKTSTDEIMIGKNHVNPALILHLAKSNKDEGMSRNKMNSIICQALRQLKTEKTGTEKAWFMSLVTLAKLKSNLFMSDKILEVLCGYLERDPAQILHKGRNSSLVSVLSWSLLMNAYKNQDNWPEIFVKVYVSDAISDRLWIDHPMCKQSCLEIVKVFGTLKPSTTSPTSSLMGPTVKHEPDPISINEDSSDGSESVTSKEFPPRFKNSAVQDSIRQHVRKTVNDYLIQKKSVDNMTRHFVKFLCTASGYKEVRQLAVSKLDHFLNSAKLSRPSQDLLSYLSANANTGSSEDVEVVQRLAQLRIKSKPMANFYTQCMKELIKLHGNNIEHLMRTVVWNELSNNRNSTNMQLIVGFFQQEPDKSAIVLAQVFQELLLKPDDCLRNLRILLREIVRCLHYDLKFSQFALALMQEITLPNFKTADPKIQERMFLSLNSLVCLAILLSCKPSIKDIAMSSTKTDVLPLIKFQNEVAVMQKNAVWWLHKVVPSQYRISAKHYYSALKQVLFLDDPSVYAVKDNWPSEADRDMYVSLCAEVPLLENTLMRLGVLGTTMSLPLRPQEVLDIINRVVRRAAMLDSENDVPPPLQVTCQLKHNLNIIQMLIRLTEYKCYNVKFPEGYTPPTLVIASHYWRAWQILLILAAFNPTTVGALAWNNHPTLRGFMEMVITNNYQFPPNSVSFQEAMVQEKQLCVAEESDILVFEGHLAAARGVKINKSNSQLLNQLIAVKEGGPMRKPPQQILDQVRLIAMELHLGHRLCKIREPDFLLDIIKQHGTSKSMSWLSQLVKSSENSFELLPVPCLCEFLLQDIQNAKRHVLLKRLQSILFSTGDSSQTQEIVEYFISKMSATYVIRCKAIKGIKTILNRPDDSTQDWLLVDMVNIPQHNFVCPIICKELRKALNVEQSSSLLGAYLIYLCRFCPPNTRVATTKDIASCMIERNHVLFKLLSSNEHVLIALLDIFCQLFLSYKGIEKGQDLEVGLKLEGSLRYFEKELIQAVLVLLAEARGRDVGQNSSVTKLMNMFFPVDDESQLTQYAPILCTDKCIPTLIGSGVSQLQSLAMHDLPHTAMIKLLQEFSLPEPAAQYILNKIDDELEDVIPLLIDEDDLLAHVQAWRINVSAGSKLESFLVEKELPTVHEVIDFFADVKSPEKMDLEEKEESDQLEWSEVFEKVFENNCIINQSHLMKYAFQGKNVEEICLTLFLWVQNNPVPHKYQNFVAVLVQILANHCSNQDLLEKLLIALSPICNALIPLHKKLFPATAEPVKKSIHSKYEHLLEWCENPDIKDYKVILKTLEDIQINEEPDLRIIGCVWQKVLKTSVRHNGSYGIDLESLVRIVVDKMIESPKCVGMFIDWLRVLSPELDCFKMFIKNDKSVPVSLQRCLLNMICSCSGWDTLHACIDKLLSEEPSGFDNSLILDFLQGCCNNERIWQGANSKRGTNKGSLKLSKQQLWKLCELIMAEIGSVNDEEKQFILLSWRLPLILSPYHTMLLPDLICRLQYNPNKCSKIVALAMYLSKPNLLSNGPSAALIRNAGACASTAAICDSLIHQLITNVCDNKKNSASGYILLRRMATCHPPLILRHLPLITSALGSRTTLTKNEFIQGNHAPVFVSIIGIIEALGSNLFKNDPDVILKECLEFVIHHTKNEMRLHSPTILKLAGILLLYLETDRTQAMKILNKERIDKLQKLENKMRDPMFTRLIDCLLNGSSPRLGEFDENQMSPYLAKLSCDSADSLTILQDLDAGSMKKPGVLKMFLHEICRRMTNEDSECRTLAHKLAIRHVRHDPKDSAVVTSFVEEALRHPQQDIVKSAIIEMPELVLLGGPETPRLMKTAFTAVCAAKSDIVPNLMTVIKTLLTSSDLF